MERTSAYQEFKKRFKLFICKYPDLITMTLSNIFTMRLIGNKTHGDLAEIGMAEFINQYMYDFRSNHVGKEKYRAKEHEEDIEIINEITKEAFPVSLKAYGNGPLQLSTDKENLMFNRLKREKKHIENPKTIRSIFNDAAFNDISNLNILPLIYDEKKKKCNILVFNYDLAKQKTAKIRKEEKGKGRKHPVYRFYDAQENYICEVRYGGATANALQRGFWTHTKNGIDCFDSLTGEWIDYSHNEILVKLFSHALVSSCRGHSLALEKIKEDINLLKQKSGIK